MRIRVEYVIREGIRAGFPVDQIAVAVLAALREPTEAMWEAGGTADGAAPEIWEAMIDAVLSEKV